MNVSVSYYRIIRPFAESALERLILVMTYCFILSFLLLTFHLYPHLYQLSCYSDLNERPKDNAEWVCDSPVNSELEAILRSLLVKLGNADKILGIQVHT